VYPPVTTQSGAKTVSDALAKFTIGPPADVMPDGLVLTPPDVPGDLAIFLPERLRSLLLDLRLLRGMPLSYLVPDAALLPHESVRFFEVDPTWTDRVIDGVIAAANIGTIDLTYSASLLPLIRDALDADLVSLAQDSAPASTWTPKSKPMTGMLWRSQVVRRWPNLTVAVTSGEGVLRAEAISADIYIALFAGRPTSLEIREPPVGTRYGVEPTETGSPPFTVDGRNPNGTSKDAADKVDVHWSNPSTRTLDIAKLSAALRTNKGFTATAKDASMPVALHLEQRAFVQQFLSNVSEPVGSQEPPPGDLVPLGPMVSGKQQRMMDISDLRRRAEQLAALGTP
jgi:hypothetical protein